MTIHFHSFSQFALNFIKEKILPPLSNQQRKIYLVAALALGCLAASFLFCRFRFQAKQERGAEKSPLDEFKFSVSPKAEETTFQAIESLTSLEPDLLKGDHSTKTASPRADTLPAEEDNLHTNPQDTPEPEFVSDEKEMPLHEPDPETEPVFDKKEIPPLELAPELYPSRLQTWIWTHAKAPAVGRSQIGQY